MPNSLARAEHDERRQHRKLLLWPLLLALLFGAVNFGELVENGLRVARNDLRSQPVSGDIVLVQIDDRSLRQVDNWPWPRSKQAELIDSIRQSGAKRLIIDILYTGPSQPEQDRALAAALERWDDVTLAAQTRIGDGEGAIDRGLPIPQFAQHARISTLAFPFDWQSAVWRLPTALDVANRRLTSLSSAIAGRDGSAPGLYRVDYSFDIATVPAFSASDVLNRRVPRTALAGKTVVLGTNSMRLGDQWMVPGTGKRGGVYVHILGAETLKRGMPLDIGWVPALLIAAAACWLAVTRNRARYLGVAAAGMLTAPVALEHLLIFADITPGLFLLAVVGGRMAWRRNRQQGLRNGLTGLPNLSALAADKSGRDRPLVAARVHNYAEIVSALDSAEERQFVEQVVQRLNVGNKERVIYQGDEGIFAWFADKGTPFGQHLEALHALFRSPVRAGKIACDVSLSFGVELGGKRAIGSRLGSALVAASEADAENLKWKFHDPAREQEAAWRLSLLSQLDEAIDKGEVWLAFQPKVDLASRRTVGAEALARWTHPEKGPISPTEFVSAAEQSDRIQRLTDFVLEQAIRAAADINRRGHHFEIAVNLSARMLSDRGLPGRVATYLALYGLEAERLILELTETAAVAGSGTGLDMLAAMRQLGVKIAIDDYGTGLSTLEYLKKVPASELKIDQSFIKAMRDHRSDLIMVQSTITLAHSLGRIVVAEGVEDPVSLEQLQAMGCDQAQGFIVGRPMGFEEMTRRLAAEKRRRAA